MGLIGIIIASLVNLFLRSSGLDWIISIIGVGVFAGLTPTIPSGSRACTTAAMTRLRRAKAAMAALPLYLNFYGPFHHAAGV